jgi:hypothetical protein
MYFILYKVSTFVNINKYPKKFFDIYTLPNVHTAI